MTVQKRDGRKVKFDKEKIKIAVLKAFIDVDGEETAYAKEKARDIANYIESLNKGMTVEEIQDEVVNKLMASTRKDVAAKYVEYRYKRRLIRESNTTDKSIIELIDGVNDYWNSENSNKSASVVTTQRDYLAGITSTDITRRFLLPEDVVQAHDEGIIHFHDADYFAQHMHNCFHKKTKFYTSEGIKTFADFNDGDSVKILDKNGEFRQATVRFYGKQRMNEIVFATPKRTKTIVCTGNHRWLLKNGSITTNLKVGDSLQGISKQENIKPETLRNCEMFTLGFLIGDGCDHDNGCGYKYNQIRLCGHKVEYVDIIAKAGYQLKPIKNTKDYLAVKKGVKKQRFLDSYAWNYLDENDKKWLFIGLYCADGAVKTNRLSTTDFRIMDLIRKTSFCAGYYITSETTETRNTKYKENFSITTFRFTVNQPDNLCWKVKSIKPYHTGTEYEAWCIEEPITHSFILDGGMITGNCCLINLEDMLQNGTVINGTLIEKPHRFLTAMTIATQIITAVTSSQYGGATITLTHLAPFVRDSYKRYLKKYLSWGCSEEKSIEWAKKDLQKEIQDGVQTFQYQLNSMTNTNGQSPFLSVFMYLGETEEYKEELSMIIQEMLLQRIEGLKNEVGVYITPAFPKLLYVLEEDNIHEDSRYWYLTELAAMCTAKRLVPDYMSEKVMKQLKDGNMYPVMGCRSALTVWHDKNDNPKFYGRFNQGVVTINLVDLALSSEGNADRFWELFEERTELCHKALKCRHERLEGTLSDAAPIMWQYGALARLDKHKPIDDLLHNGYSTLSLGYAGLYECVRYMTGKSHTDNAEGTEFGLKVMRALNDKCNQWKKEEKIDYSLYGTPIESTTYKFAKCLQKRFGVIEGITDKNYITNSYHVNVREEIDPFAKLEIESKFQELSPGGAISYIESSNMNDNTPALLEVMKFIYENIMYAEINTKSDYCQVCGYNGEIQIVKENGELIWECPNCKNRDQDKMNIARRTCGYIGSHYWNQGRTQEIMDRWVHLDDHKYKEGD